MSPPPMELLAPEKRLAVRMIREELCCKLCGRVFEDPHCLDCKHNFCRDCIFLHLRKSESSCPKCKLPTRPSEITKNQFLQSILSAWKAVEATLAPLEDPDSTAALEKFERQHEIQKKAKEPEVVSSRGPVSNQKWNINTAELRQEAEAAERRANAIELFGGSLVQRAALKNAALDASNNAAATAAAPTTKRSGFGAAHLNKRANGQSGNHGRSQTQQSVVQEDPSQTQMTNMDSQMMSPRVRRPSPFSPVGVSQHGSSLSSLSSPFSVLGTQDVQGVMLKIQSHNHFLDEWAKKSKKNASMVLLPMTGFRASPASSVKSEGKQSRPVISAVQRAQELIGAAGVGLAKARSPGKRKRRIFQPTTDSSEEEKGSEVEENGHSQTQTQMPGTLADSPDLLGFGGVAPPVGSVLGRFSTSPALAARLGGKTADPGDENDHDKSEWMHGNTGSRTATVAPKRNGTKHEPVTLTRMTKKRLIVHSSQVAPDVVDMTQDDDDDEDDVVEDSQMHSVLAANPVIKKRASEDFKSAIRAFHESANGRGARLHRLSGGDEPVFESPPASRLSGATSATKGIAAKPSVPTTRPMTTTSVQVSSTTRPPLISNSSATRSEGRTKSPTINFVFVGTDLSKDESKTVLIACQRLGGRFGRDFDVKRDAKGTLKTSVTHLITKSVPVGQSGENLGLRCKRTAKYMRALAEGTFVVDYSWVEASLAHDEWLPEEKYEMSGDIYSDAVGKPRESRLLHLRTGTRNEIFQHFQFVLLCPENEFDFMLDSLRSIVVNFGANVEMAHSGNRANALPAAPRGKSNLGIVSKVMDPLDAKRLWDIYQIPIVRVTWIFDSISHLEVLPCDDYYPY